MNIAILIPTLSYGGAERVAAEISKYFLQKKHNIYIFTEQIGCEKYDFAGKVIQLQRIGNQYSDFGSWHAAFYSLQKRAMEIRKLKRQYKIDVSVSFMELYNMVNILSKGRERVIVRVCTVLSFRDSSAKLYNPKLIAFLYNRADCVVAISHYGMRDMVQRYRIKKSLVRVIPNSVETAADGADGNEWTYGENAIICLARIFGVKQQGLLIDIFADIKRQVPDAKLLLAGEDTGEYAAFIKKKARGMSCGKDIVFIGHVNNTRHYLRHSKLYVLLSKVEGFGNATIEAMSVGVPVVCMDSPGAAREILAPHTKRKDLNEIEYAEYGILVPFIDEMSKSSEYAGKREIIAKAVVEIMGSKSILDKYSQQGKKRASDFTIKRVGKMWDKVVGD